MEEQRQTVCFIDTNVAYGILITVYTVVLIGGFTGTVLMFIFLCRTNTRSLTTTAVMNLLIIHSIFIVSVPFRIAYYIQNRWIFGFVFCKLVSAMIHIHMYLSFIFYTVILVIRYLCFFRDKDKIEFYRKLHAVVASATVWAVTLIIILPVIITQYGNNATNTNESCFMFQNELKKNPVMVLNYLFVAVVMAVVCGLLLVQIIILVKLVKNLQGPILSHQEIRAQLKSLFFIFIMIVCFFPYHMLRIYYVHHPDECFYFNEICLSITALSCLDLLAFALKICSQKLCSNFGCTINCFHR
ncbi:probable G-protein coupled receptor 141 [Bombina bombina]|uniref:probable G-protein coupled receptor 141 n=1 Tax=Bombina bombina TaxID=8345 RepID=UPI00235B12A1|nr:probable G-protein coupled receptor 141 [Bombina bombina]